MSVTASTLEISFTGGVLTDPLATRGALSKRGALSILGGWSVVLYGCLVVVLCGRQWPLPLIETVTVTRPSAIATELPA